MSKIKANQHESYATYSILAVIFPVIGLILGIVALSKEGKLDKKLGEHTIAVSILFMCLWSIFWVFVVVPYLSEGIVESQLDPAYTDYYGP